MPKLTKDSVAPISLGLLAMMTMGVWTLANRVNEFNHRLHSLESRIGWRWNFLMMREYNQEFQRMNPDLETPSVERIREIYLEN